MRNKCLGVFLVFVTVPLVMLSIFTVSSGKLMQLSYYKDLFKKSNSYQATLQALPKNTATAQKEDILTLISTNATPAWLEQTIGQNLDQFDAYFNNRSQKVDPSIDITSFKKNLVADLPTEVQEMVPNVISFTTYNEYLKNTNQLMTDAIKTTPGTNPNDLTELNKQTQSTQTTQDQFMKNIDSVKKGFFYGKIITYIIYGLTFLMLLTIALAARHYWPAIFRWTGQTLFIGGLLSLGGAFLTQFFVKNYDIIASLKISSEFKQVVKPLYLNITTDISTDIIKIGFGVTVVGLIFIIVSYILSKFVPEPPKPVPAPIKN